MGQSIGSSKSDRTLEEILGDRLIWVSSIPVRTLAGRGGEERKVSRGIKDIYAGKGILLARASEGSLFAFDMKGDFQWQKGNEGGKETHKFGTVYEERFVYVSDEGLVKALDLTTGGELWQTKLYEAPPNRNRPCVNMENYLFVMRHKKNSRAVSHPFQRSGLVLYGTDRGEIQCIDISNGQVIDRLAYSYNSPGGEYFYQHHSLEEGDVLLIKNNKSIWAIDLKTMESKWPDEYRTPGPGLVMTLAPLVAKGITIFYNKDPNIAAIDIGSGGKKWEKRIGGEVISDMAESDGILYFVFCDERGSKLGVRAMSLETGEELWQSLIGRYSTELQPTPVIHNNAVYNISKDGLYAFDAKEGTTLNHWDIKTSFIATPIIKENASYIGIGDKIAALKPLDN